MTRANVLQPSASTSTVSGTFTFRVLFFSLHPVLFSLSSFFLSLSLSLSSPLLFYLSLLRVFLRTFSHSPRVTLLFHRDCMYRRLLSLLFPSCHGRPDFSSSLTFHSLSFTVHWHSLSVCSFSFRPALSLTLH